MYTSTVVQKSVNKQTRNIVTFLLYQAGFTGLHETCKFLFVVVVCQCIVYQQFMTICCESHKTLSLYKIWCVPFLSYMNMHIL